MIRKKAVWQWTKQQKEAFDAYKNALSIYNYILQGSDTLFN